MTKEEFKEIRIIKNLYQREIAEYLGVATVTVRFYEGGHRKIRQPIANLMRILKNKRSKG